MTIIRSFLEKASIISALILFTCLSAAAADVIQQQAAGLEMKIRADSAIEYDVERQTFLAQPNVTVTYGDMVLNAERIEGDLKTGELRAHGQVVFSAKDRQLKCEDMVYNTKTGIGRTENASSFSNGVYFTGREMSVQENMYSLYDSRFTSCSLDHPHYYISAKELTLIPGKELIAKKVEVVVLGRRIASLPRYRVSLEEPREHDKQAVPPITVSSKYGLMVGREVDLSQGTKTEGTFSAGLSSKQLLVLGVYYDKINSMPIFLRGTYKMPVYEGTRSGTMVTRVPEIGARFTIGPDAKKLETDRRTIGLSTGVKSTLRPGEKSGRFNLLSEVGAGYFLEKPSGASSSRMEARVAAWMSPTRISGNICFQPGVSARFSHYGNGKDYEVLGFRMGLGTEFSKDTTVELIYENRIVRGSTPFDFDRNELKEELTMKAKAPLGEYELGFTPRYDLQRGEFYDIEYSIGRKYHCLEPTISWKNRFSQLSLGLTLVGL